MPSRPKEDIKIVLLWPKGAFYLIGGAWRLASSAPIKDHQNEPNFWTVFQGPKKKRQKMAHDCGALKSTRSAVFRRRVVLSRHPPPSFPPDPHRLHFFPNARRLHFSQVLTTFAFLRFSPSSLFFSLKRLKGRCWGPASCLCDHNDFIG